MLPPATAVHPFLSGEISLRLDPLGLCGALRRSQPVSLLLDGTGGFRRPWNVGRLVAIEPRIRLEFPDSRHVEAEDVVKAIESLVDSRRGASCCAATGIVVLLAYDAPLGPLDRPRADGDRGSPSIVVAEVDRSVRFHGDRRPVLTVRGSDGVPDEADWSALAVRLESLAADTVGESPARVCGKVRTSLPRDSYLRAVGRVKELIVEGEIYQANLCQRFTAEYAGDEFALYRELSRRCPAPRSAFFETETLALASVSPEIFLSVRPPDRISTHPIKGTRPRGVTPEEDDAERRDLLGSDKDRAELLMIVDLERNDLGRVCRTGSVEVPELLALQTFPAVHHLVARVEGRLRDGVGVGRLMRAMFPGGSITGAPKIRAMEVLSEIEPVRRGFFTGSLLWFGDDGSVDSSILIRTVEFRGGRVFVGAGGGVVADSDPEEEWRESNHKAAALTQALGFRPEDAR